MDIFGVLTLVGGLALFLFGMSVMGSGLEKLSGGRLERLLERLTSNPLKAVLLGAGVTAVIQSSSATTVMVVGFVNSGIMKLSQAIGIIMGANVGNGNVLDLKPDRNRRGERLDPSVKTFVIFSCFGGGRHYFVSVRQTRKKKRSGRNFSRLFGINVRYGDDERSR